MTRQGSFETPPLTELVNNHIFSGNENDIVAIRDYTTQFICNFNMQFYPFDIQECEMTFMLTASHYRYSKPLPGKLIFRAPKSLVQYVVHDYAITNSTKLDSGEELIYIIRLGREPSNQITTIYLPTAMICAIAFCTNFYQNEYFEAAVVVNLTSLLCILSLFVSVNSSLPKTAGLKLVDLWFIVSMFVPFIEVFLLTIMEKIRLQSSGILGSVQISDSDESNELQSSGTLVMIT